MLSSPIDNKKVKAFYEKIRPKVSNYASLGICEEDLRRLLIGKPLEIKGLNDELMKTIIPGFKQNVLDKYLKQDKKKRVAFRNYHNKYEQVKKIFNYNNIICKSYFLANLLEINTCIYCNRNYVKTIGDDNDKINRPQYDHFYSQSKYPLLALSFYNLIPVCASCNTKKNNKTIDLTTHLHPYIESDEEKKFNFSYRKVSLLENNVKIDVATKDPDAKEKIKNSIADLNLVKIYNANSEMELRDLLNLRYKYSENYLDILMNKTFTKIKISKNEIYRMVFGIEIEEENFHKRPFSKFKRDIIEELLKK